MCSSVNAAALHGGLEPLAETVLGQAVEENGHVVGSHIGYEHRQLLDVQDDLDPGLGRGERQHEVRHELTSEIVGDDVQAPYCSRLDVEEITANLVAACR